METHVRKIKYRPSPIPSGRLEIPIILVVKRGDSSMANLKKLESYAKSFYVELDKTVHDGTDEER